MGDTAAADRDGSGVGSLARGLDECVGGGSSARGGGAVCAASAALLVRVTRATLAGLPKVRSYRRASARATNLLPLPPASLVVAVPCVLPQVSREWLLEQRGQ